MWQQEVSNYHDETYYLFNEAMNNYLSRLQKIHNRGMVESWIEEGTIEQKSLWTETETVKYLQSLPYPENDIERKIWLAGFSATRTPLENNEAKEHEEAPQPSAKVPTPPKLSSEEQAIISQLVG